MCSSLRCPATSHRATGSTVVSGFSPHWRIRARCLCFHLCSKASAHLCSKNIFNLLPFAPPTTAAGLSSTSWPSSLSADYDSQRCRTIPAGSLPLTTLTPPSFPFARFSISRSSCRCDEWPLRDFTGWLEALEKIKYHLQSTKSLYKVKIQHWFDQKVD